MRIAVVGAGVAGLTAAHLLHREHEVVIYEAASYSGGHVNTVRVDTPHHTHHLDTGFIVMNDRNYPNFTALLDRLCVARQPTRMSFSVSEELTGLEYAGTPRGLFCQPANALRRSHWRMIADLVRFNRQLGGLLAEGGSNESLGELLDRGGYCEPFVRRLIIPQVSAVWSASSAQALQFPVSYLARFLDNHGMLSFRSRPRWSTVSGGSARYVEALTRPFRERIRLRCRVHSVARAEDHVLVSAVGGEPERYDHVVLATHSEDALAMLADPSEQERRLLGAIPYQLNEAVLHTDSTLLPRRRAARAAWNYHALAEPRPLTTITYYMNHLQRITADRDFCVTLNRTEAIDPEQVIRVIPYAHPVYTPEGVAAQGEHRVISNLSTRTHYCGAYWGWGFHEDGVVSAMRACEAFGVRM